MSRESLNNLRPRPAWRRGDPSPNPAGRALHAGFGHITAQGSAGIEKYYRQHQEEQRRSRHEAEERIEQQQREIRGESEPIDKYDWSGQRAAARARRGFGERRHR
jgi:hypothetical protein